MPSNQINRTLILRKDALIPATMVIAAGQSNAIGWGQDPANCTAMTNGYGYWFYPSTITSNVVRDGVLLPLSPMKLGRTQCGPQTAFCQTWAAGGGGPVIWVDAAVVGSSLIAAAQATLTGANTVNASGGTWDPSAASNVYDAWCVPTVKAAMAAARDAGFAIRHVVVFWNQGEKDAGANALANGTTYRSKLNTLIGRFVSDFGVKLFMIIKTTYPSDPSAFNSYFVDIRAAQDLVASDNPTLCPTPWETSAYYNNGWYVDTLHYKAAGYNDHGSGMATRGLAMLKPNLPLPPASVFNRISTAFPPIVGWKRILFRHVSSGTFNNDIYGGPNTPYAMHWIDGSGINRAYSGQSMSWTFSDARTKDACLYISDTVGASASLVGGASCKYIKTTVLDKGVKLNRFSLGSYANGYQISDVDLLRIAWQGAPLLDFYNVGNVTGLTPKLSYTSAALAGIPSGANIYNTGLGAPLLDLSQSGGSNVKSLTHAYCGLTVAQVNTLLQQLDANGFSGGTINTIQYSATLGTAAAAPTGAGATAKSNLQARGYTVSTD